MAELVPEFISVLRDIRDNKYPDIVTKHDTVVAKEALVNPHYNAIDTVSTNIANVNTVATNDSNVTSVAGNIANVNTVGENIANVNLTGNSIENVNTTATNISSIGTVATDLDLGVSSKISIVASNILSVNSVSSNIDSITTVEANLTNIDLNATNIVAIQNASANALSALASKEATDANVVLTNADVATTEGNVVICTEKADIAQQVLDMTANASTLVEGSLASASYNPTTGVMTFGIPVGATGEKGDPFVVNAIGVFADRATYDTQPKGFSFLATDLELIYFKLSATSGDWSDGATFGKGDKGDTGNGVASITKTSTNGNVDTYTITYTDTTTTTFDVTNGTVISVNGQEGVVVLAKGDIGLGNVDNTSDVNKPISTATQTALNSKANSADVYTQTQIDTTLGLKKDEVNIVSKTSAYTAVNNDFIKSDSTTSSFTNTLPATPTAKTRVYVIKTDASTNTVTVDGNGNNIDLQNNVDTNLVIDLQGIIFEFFFDGTVWRVKIW